jgi:caa(3)-type oxidase subunit IV
MADNVEEIQKSVKTYMKVLVSLGVLTVITVGLSMVEMPTHGQNILIGMILASFKAALVALIFMHLNHERSVIYKLLIFTGVFAVVLFVLFHMAHTDPLVDPYFDSTSAAAKGH